MLCEKTQRKLPLEGLADSQQQKQNQKPLVATDVSGAGQEKRKWFRARNARRRQRIIAAGLEAIKADRDRARIAATQWRAKQKGEHCASADSMRLQYLKSRLSKSINLQLRQKLNWTDILKQRRADGFQFVQPAMRWPLNPSLIRFGALIGAMNAEALRDFQDRYIGRMLHLDANKISLMNAKTKDARSMAYKRRRQNPEAAKVLRAMSARHFQTHRDKIYAYRKRRLETDPVWRTRSKEYMREWFREKRRTDPQYNIGNRLRSRLWHAVTSSRGKKAAKTEDLVGCSVATLRAYLESKFTVGMSWESFMRGEIEIDHILPCASFDLKNPEAQRRCFHWTNLQPLWQSDNRSKRDKPLTTIAA